VGRSTLEDQRDHDSGLLHGQQDPGLEVFSGQVSRKHREGGA